jgi:hypothetical protein
LQEEDDEDKEPGGEGGAGEEDTAVGEDTKGFNSFSWLLLIKRVSDLTKLDWERIWEMDIYLFFNYLQFDVTYKEWEQREIDKWRKEH